MTPHDWPLPTSQSIFASDAGVVVVGRPISARSKAVVRADERCAGGKHFETPRSETSNDSGYLPAASTFDESTLGVSCGQSGLAGTASLRCVRADSMRISSYRKSSKCGDKRRNTINPMPSIETLTSMADQGTLSWSLGTPNMTFLASSTNGVSGLTSK